MFMLQQQQRRQRPSSVLVAALLVHTTATCVGLLAPTQPHAQAAEQQSQVFLLTDPAVVNLSALSSNGNETKAAGSSSSHGTWNWRTVVTPASTAHIIRSRPLFKMGPAIAIWDAFCASIGAGCKTRKKGEKFVQFRCVQMCSEV